MKKIIYSLVIMIAAGSLFTSCIDQVEPVGILDMRTAKAEYIRALKDLRAADAEYRRAEAAVQLANAAYRQAETAWMQEQVNNQKLLNELQALKNEAQAMANEQKAAEVANQIDSLEKVMAEREVQHATNLVNLSNNLAKAEEDLRVTLRNIALASQELTREEKQVIQDAVNYYWKAYEEVAEQSIALVIAQRKLDSLNSVYAVGEDVYDKPEGKYIGEVEQWKKQIAAAEKMKARLIDLLENAPDSLNYEDVNTWKEEIDQLVADSAAVEYSKYLVTKDIAEYYVNYVHDGVKAFNAAAELWNKENPKPDAPGSEPKKSDYTSDYADSLEFEPFVNSDAITDASFTKFAYLLNSYATLTDPISTPKSKFMKTTADTIAFVGKISQKTDGMMDFIMGDLGNGEKSQKLNDTTVANYGLWGAYDVLARELVTEKKKAADPEKLLEAVKEKDSIWAAHRQILIDGLAKYEPFVDTVALFELAIAKENADLNDMNDAIEALATALNPLVSKDPTLTKADGGAYIDYHDSTQVFAALVAFAAARNEYFDYEYDPENDAHDLNYFRFATGQDNITLDAIVDSVLFTDLTFEALSKHIYDYDAAGDGVTKFQAGTAAGQFGLANIINQLVGADFATKLQTNTIPAFVYDPIEFFGGAYRMNGGVAQEYDDATATWVAYTPELSIDYEAAVKRVAQEFVDVYNDFWAEGATVSTEMDAFITTVETELAKTKPDYDKIDEALEAAVEAVENLLDPDLDPECYTLNTFKPYDGGDITPIVVFNANDSIIYTNAIGAILGSVDPNKTADPTGANFDKDGAVAGSAIFNVVGTKTTDFYDLMLAVYDYWLATTTTLEQDLAVIEAWVEKVEGVFDADEDQKGTFDEKGYNDAVKKYNENKEKMKIWEEKAVAYTGDKVAARTITGTYNTPESITWPNTFEMAELFEAPLEGYTGEWKAKIGGKKFGGEQVELLETLFPEFPVKLAEWYDTVEEVDGINDQLAHYKTLLKSLREAYYAAALAAGEKVGDASNWDELVKNYTEANKNHRKVLVNYIKQAQKIIDDNTKNIADFEHGKPMLQIAIDQAKVDLAEVETKLAAAQTALDYAKANLQRVLDYMKSLDANFLNGSHLDFPWN